MWSSGTYRCCNLPISDSVRSRALTFRPVPFKLTLFLTLIGVGVLGLTVQTYAAFEDGFIGARAFAMGGSIYSNWR